MADRIESLETLWIGRISISTILPRAIVKPITETGRQSGGATGTRRGRGLAIRTPERLNQLVTDALMIPLVMVGGHGLGYRATKMSLPQGLSDVAERLGYSGASSA